MLTVKTRPFCCAIKTTLKRYTAGARVLQKHFQLDDFLFNLQQRGNAREVKVVFVETFIAALDQYWHGQLVRTRAHMPTAKLTRSARRQQPGDVRAFVSRHSLFVRIPGRRTDQLRSML